MLKGIPTILSPELVKIMMEMGHGDEIVLADGNFPCNTFSQRVVRADGHNIPELLTAMLQLLPLDTYSEKNTFLMQVVEGDPTVPVVWDEYEAILKEGSSDFKGFENIERFDFYDRAKKAFAVIATSEKALYGNIILKKGVI